MRRARSVTTYKKAGGFFSLRRGNFLLQSRAVSCKIRDTIKYQIGSCKEVLRARAATITRRRLSVSNPTGVWNIFCYPSREKEELSMKLVTNGRLITRDSENRGYYEHGAVAYEGSKIAAVGEESILRAKYPDAEVIDARGGVIMPAFINAHTHIYSALARGLAIAGNNPTNFYEVLDGTWWAIDRRLTLAGHARLGRRALHRLHQAGCDHDLRPPRLLRRDSGEPVHHQRERQKVRHPQLPVLRGLRPRRRGEVPAGHQGKRRLHHLLSDAPRPDARGDVRRARALHHQRQDASSGWSRPTTAARASTSTSPRA